MRTKKKFSRASYALWLFKRKGLTLPVIAFAIARLAARKGPVLSPEPPLFPPLLPLPLPPGSPPSPPGLPPGSPPSPPGSPPPAPPPPSPKPEAPPPPSPKPESPPPPSPPPPSPRPESPPPPSPKPPSSPPPEEKPSPPSSPPPEEKPSPPSSPPPPPPPPPLPPPTMFVVSIILFITDLLAKIGTSFTEGWDPETPTRARRTFKGTNRSALCDQMDKALQFAEFDIYTNGELGYIPAGLQTEWRTANGSLAETSCYGTFIRRHDIKPLGCKAGKCPVRLGNHAKRAIGNTTDAQLGAFLAPGLQTDTNSSVYSSRFWSSSYQNEDAPNPELSALGRSSISKEGN